MCYESSRSAIRPAKEIERDRRAEAERIAKQARAKEKHDIELPAGRTKSIVTGSGTNGDNFRVVYNGKRYNAISFETIGDRPVAGIADEDSLIGPAVVRTTGLVALVVNGNNLEPVAV